MARISISSKTSGATIRYTTNGSDPTEASAVYSSPFIAEGITVKAKGYKTGLAPSAVASQAIPQENPTNWVTVSGISITLRGAAYGNGKFVICGNTGIYYSTYGITWTAANHPFTKYIYNVAYGNGKFVAIGMNSSSNTELAYSTDGITWTAVTQSAVPRFGQAICFGGGKFVIGGYDSGTNTAMAYSTDGITWHAATVNGLTRYASSICYGAGKFIVCNNGAGGAAYSTDGITWVAITSNLSAVGLTNPMRVCYGAGKFIITGSSGGAAYSTDGITWVAFSQSLFTNVSALFYDYGKFLIGGRNSSTVCLAYSRDGITWVSISSGAYTTNINSFAYGNGRYIMCGASGLLAYCG